MLQIGGWGGGGIVIPMPEALSFAESRRQQTEAGEKSSWITQCGAIKTSSVGLETSIVPAQDQVKTALAVIRKAHKARTTFPVGSFGKWPHAVRVMARIKAYLRHQVNPSEAEVRPECLMEAAATLIIMARYKHMRTTSSTLHHMRAAGQRNHR
jgi:hypothetical protein